MAAEKTEKIQVKGARTKSLTLFQEMAALGESSAQLAKIRNCYSYALRVPTLIHRYISSNSMAKFVSEICTLICAL
jgi:hypothetical protein